MRILVALFLLLPALAMAASPVSLVEIPLDGPGDEVRFRSVVGDLDVLMVKPGSYARLAVRERDQAILARAGIPITMITEDMEAAFSFRDKGPGYGIYHTWSENIAFVDSLRLLHPDVVSAKWSIGLTLEGRDIWAFRVSANPDVDEDEPEILIDAAHHAREVMSSEFAIMFAEYLAQNYGTDPEVTWLLDNRELYIVPIVNPDGFVYNETIEPDGGGMWRKNRRDNGDGTMGVDLNRNYPYQWGYDDSGSSPTSSSETYRGTSAGSEPETQVMMAFINSREFRIQDSVHTYSNLLLYPWAYDNIVAPDDAVLASMGALMTQYNGYQATPGYGLYPVNGDTSDWSYGATGEHDRIFAFSTEIGGSTDGFWPPESRRGALFRENIWPHICMMRAAGPFVVVHSPVTVPDPAKAVSPGENGLLTFSVQNQAATMTSAPLTVTLTSDDPWLYLHETERGIGALTAQATDDLTADPVPFSVDPDCPSGHLATVTATVAMPEGPLEFPMQFVVGTGQALVFDDLEAGSDNWVLNWPWSLTASTSHSGANCLTDSPGGEYQDMQGVSATLMGARRATAVTFWHRYSIEEGWDYGRLQVKPAGGDWTTVASYTGTQATWVQETVTLESWLGQELEIRFLLDTDQSVTDDGWYVDDVEIFGLPSDNLAPDVPGNLPADGAGLALVLRAAVGPDPEGSPVVGGFRLYHLVAGAWELMAESDDVPAAAGEITWTTPPLPDGDYMWRAWAGDGEVRSDLSADWPFIVSGVSAVGTTLPTGPSLRVLGAGDGRVRLQVGLTAAAAVTVDVFDVRGARVRQLHSGHMASGRVLVWDGRDGSGRGVASGVYLVRAQVGRTTLTDRVVLVR